uniref:ENT domain-containing protein n=2 Tax=Cannabis sativa TaxID=3483 RepID=A0A803R9T3_CANSA
MLNLFSILSSSITITGTDDDIPPSHQNRVPRGSRVAGNERSAVGSISYPRMYADMETQIHNLEQEAYCAVLRAFVAQSDALTWEKEGLITELRKELRVSDDEHRELLTRVNADDIVSKIREWRKSGGNQSVRLNQSQSVYDVLPSPTVLTSRKKQRISQTGHQFPGLSSMKSIHTPSTGLVSNRSFLSRSSSGVRATNEPAEAANFDSLIGRRVWTRWPEDNSFYEAVITDYNDVEVFLCVSVSICSFKTP